MNKKGLNLIELIEVIVIVAVLAAILFPVFQRAMKAQAVQCQANMCTIGKAMKMYLSDWDDKYPTNRPFMPNSNPPTLWSINFYVPLSDPDKTDINGQSIRFQYGYSWVEGLYPYIERPDFSDGSSVWRCPSARDMGFINNGVQGIWPRVTYAFNRNLVERPKLTVRYPAKTMMLRELDKRYNSVLRPFHECIQVSVIPMEPFLGPKDMFSDKIKYKLHGDGSNILFADGHVKNFPASYFTNSTGQWDPESRQWYNWVNLPSTDTRRKSIAISP